MSASIQNCKCHANIDDEVYGKINTIPKILIHKKKILNLRRVRTHINLCYIIYSS
jgi:hypothetical protein